MAKIQVFVLRLEVGRLECVIFIALKPLDGSFFC
jgi:hypothetical protein